MEIKKHGYKLAIFVINLLIVALAVCGMKTRDKNNFSLESNSNENIAPVGIDILKSQNEIAVERENKLRDLNNAPKSIEQRDTTTKTTTVTPAPVKAPDKKTKSS